VGRTGKSFFEALTERSAVELGLFLQVLFFISGAMIGSFLNVCIIRLPQEKSVITPGSHCTKCQKPIRWFDNIPIISYLVLRGKCRDCGSRFSIRYPLIELLTALTFLEFYLYFGSTWLLLPYLLMVSGFIVGTIVDLEHRILPDEVTLGGTIAGLIFSLLIPQLHATDSRIWSLGQSGLGILVGGGLIYLMGLFGEWVFKKEAMGGGDVKLLAMVGSFLGWKYALLTFFLAPFFGSIVGIIEKIRTKDNTIAYGPYLVIGALVSLFWGQRIIYLIMTGQLYTFF
jgi:leader peptidase (prepilin peptidase)/N-methyltransferase